MCLLYELLKGKMERKGRVRRKMALAAIIGAAAGVVAGVLLAPRAGKETREELMNNIKELPDKAKELSEKTHEKLEEVKEKIVDETHKILGSVKETVSEAEDALDEGSRFKNPSKITEEEVDSFKNKLK